MGIDVSAASGNVSGINTGLLITLTTSVLIALTTMIWQWRQNRHRNMQIRNAAIRSLYFEVESNRASVDAFIEDIERAKSKEAVTQRPDLPMRSAWQSAEPQLLKSGLGPAAHFAINRAYVSWLAAAGHVDIRKQGATLRAALGESHREYLQFSMPYSENVAKMAERDGKAAFNTV